MPPSSHTAKTLPEYYDGVNLIRIVAMLAVVVLHFPDFMGFGAAGTPAYMAECEYAMSSLGVVCINLFAMLTGFLCVDKQWKLARYAEIWLQVLFYNLLFFLLANFAHFGCLPLGSLLRRLYPFASQYWYFTAYSTLFCVLPFLNKVLASSTKKQMLWLLSGLFCAFSLGGLHDASYLADYGTNPTWLGVMYIVGAYFKLFPVKQRRLLLMLLYAGGVLLNWGLLHCRGYDAASRICISYTSPLVIVQSCSLFLLLLGVKVAWLPCRKTLALLATTSFGVYLFHCHSTMWVFLHSFVKDWVRETDFAWWTIPVTCVVIYLCGTLVDSVRVVLFRVLCVKSACNALAEHLTAFLKRRELTD